ncbi:MAG: hypothetical protein Q9160_007499 [Pyrenula sp. 1 TL-2023]
MGHEYFAEVSEDFIEDDFNLTGLQPQVPMYKDALEMILDVEPSDSASSAMSEEEEEEDEDDGILGDESRPPGSSSYGRRSSDGRRHLRVSSDASVIESSAELLYGLIHARYITSRPGIQQMMEKYELSHFGHCPRVYCSGTKVLPVGRTDTPGQETVKLFCPSCLDIYTPPNSRFSTVDGAFFGTTFGCLFFMTFPELEVAPHLASNRNVQENNILSPTSTTNTASSMSIDNASRTSSLTLAGTASASVALAPVDEKITIPQPTTLNGVSTSNLAPGLGKGKIYEPKIYGFRVSERAKSGPRMKWLRMKPADITELDETTRYHERYGGDPDGDPDPQPPEDGDVEMRSQTSRATGNIGGSGRRRRGGSGPFSGSQRRRARRRPYRDNGMILRGDVLGQQDTII